MLGYDNILFLGDSGSEPSETFLNDFCSICKLSNLVKEPLCFKNPNNPSCIIEKDMSDFHLMIVTVLYKKQKPTNIQHRNYKNFSNDVFWQEQSE